MDPILVTGAGGQVGGIGQKIVENLLDENLHVRAMLRVHDRRAEELAQRGVEVVIGDLTHLGDVHRAVSGCKRIYFGIGVSPQYLEVTVNVAAVAKHYHVEALVNMSQMTVSQMSIKETTDSPQQKLHWLSEQVLDWSGLPVVHVRPTVFLENPFFLSWASESIAEASALRLPFGSGKSSPVAGADVARVITRILLEPQAHIGKVYELTGAKSESMAEIAQEYAMGLGRPIKSVDIPFDEWMATELSNSGLSPHVMAHLATMALLHRENRYDRLTSDVQKITGSPPLTIQNWVRMNRQQFR
jgi:uncharacterized protein YbjT (DUF2867 family)